MTEGAADMKHTFVEYATYFMAMDEFRFIQRSFGALSNLSEN